MVDNALNFKQVHGWNAELESFVKSGVSVLDEWTENWKQEIYEKKIMHIGLFDDEKQVAAILCSIHQYKATKELHIVYAGGESKRYAPVMMKEYDAMAAKFGCNYITATVKSPAIEIMLMDSGFDGVATWFKKEVK